MDIQSDSLKKQVGKFAIVGIINTLIDVIILNSLVFLGFTAVLMISEQKFLIANIISVAIAMVNSFILNKQWTFKAEKGNIYKQIFQFLIITIIGIFVIHQIHLNRLYDGLPSISNLIVSIIHFLKLGNIFSDSFITLNFAKIIAIIGSLIWNFIGYKLVVFKNKSS